MKYISLITAIALVLVINPVNAQTTLLTEEFETDGEGTRYTSNPFDNACHDFFERYSNGGGNCLTNEPSNVSGTFYWAGEDVDVASGGTGIVTLFPATVTGYSLELKVLAAIGRPNDGRFENIDELLFQYNMDGAGWVTCGAFYGNNDTPPFAGNLAQDVDLDGSYDVGGLEISSSDFTEWTFPINATGNSLQVRFVCGHDAGTEEVMIDNLRIIGMEALPIQLVDFNLNQTDKGQVHLNWKTASEVNNDYFTIERSNNSTVWEEILDIAGSGNSNTVINYSAVDNHPINGTSYYRLKQTDMDNKYSYSEVKSVTIRNKKSPALSIYPNPTADELTIDALETELGSVEIINAIGQSVSNQVIINHTSDSQIKIDVSRMAPGLYFIKTKNSMNKVYIVD